MVRKSFWLAWALAAALWSACPQPVWAATGPELLERGRQLYTQARFDPAQDELRQALGHTDLSPRQRAQAWTWLGLCYLGLGSPPLALEAFVSARAADKAFAPEGDDLSPKARELWELSDPARPRTDAASPASPAAPTPQVKPAEPVAIKESSLTPAPPRLHSPALAYDVRQGRPVGVTRVFAPSAQRIHLWFALENVPEGAALRAVWSYLTEPPVQIVSSEMPAPGYGSWAQFACQLAPGKPWPSGRYQVELFLDQDLAHTLEFEVP